MYFRPMNQYSDYLKALGMVIYHVIYYGPTYYIVISSILGIDYYYQMYQ